MRLREPVPVEQPWSLEVIRRIDGIYPCGTIALPSVPELYSLFLRPMQVNVKQRPFFPGMGAAIIRPCYREADVGLRRRAGNPNCGLRVISPLISCGIGTGINGEGDNQHADPADISSEHFKPLAKSQSIYDTRKNIGKRHTHRGSLAYIEPVFLVLVFLGPVI